jgi:threonine dehydratase
MHTAFMSAQYEMTYEDVLAAGRRLEGVAHRTPVMTSRTADQLAGCSIFFKCENFQKTGAFKFRGAYNAVRALSDDERRRGVITYSSGNHAQALAAAARLLDVPTAVLMPHDAAPAKIAATRAYGGDIIFYDRHHDEREAICAELVFRHGFVVVPPFDHPHVIAGQGTAAKELFEEVGDLDYLFACVGGGGLLAGCALTAHTLSPDCRLIGVEPEGANDAQQSFRQGTIVRIAAPESIADGALVPSLGRANFSIIRTWVDDIITVSDAALLATMRFFAERMKMIVEPTGCLAAAATLNRMQPYKGRRVGVLISGGNVDLAMLASALSAGNPDVAQSLEKSPC